MAFLTCLGIRRDDRGHSSPVIGDFAGPAYSRLVELTGAEAATPLVPVREAARATVGEVDLTLARMPIGAPAAAIVDGKMVVDLWAGKADQAGMVLPPKTPFSSLSRLFPWRPRHQHGDAAAVLLVGFAKVPQ